MYDVCTLYKCMMGVCVWWGVRVCVDWFFCRFNVYWVRVLGACTSRGSATGGTTVSTGRTRRRVEWSRSRARRASTGVCRPISASTTRSCATGSPTVPRARTRVRGALTRSAMSSSCAAHTCASSRRWDRCVGARRAIDCGRTGRTATILMSVRIRRRARSSAPISRAWRIATVWMATNWGSIPGSQTFSKKKISISKKLLWTIVSELLFWKRTLLRNFVHTKLINSSQNFNWN